MTSIDIAPPEGLGKKRFFYTDPLAAAWMAKNFGMKFGVRHNGTIHWNCIGKINEPFEPLQRPEDILDPISQSQPLYIHPDSLHLLEPQVGDLTRWITGVGEAWEQTHHDLINEELDALSKASRRLTLWKGQIIQRNGISFMWPESEAA